MKTRRIFIATGGALMVLLVVQLVTYSLFAQDRAPLASIRALHHYPSITDWDVVHIEASTWHGLSRDQQTILSQALKANVPTLYVTEADIPAEAYHREPFTAEEIARREETYHRAKEGGSVSAESLAAMREETERGYRILGFRSGGTLSWKLEEDGLFWMTASTSWWASMTGAVWRRDLYIWVLCRWVRIRNLEHVQS